MNKYGCASFLWQCSAAQCWSGEGQGGGQQSQARGLRACIVKGARVEGADEIVVDMMILNLVWKEKEVSNCEETGRRACDKKKKGSHKKHDYNMLH